MLVNNDQSYLFLELSTWTNDTNGIYDYSTDAVKTVKANICEQTYIVRTKNNTFKNIPQHSEIDEDKGNELIFWVNNGYNNNFKLINPIPHHLKLTQENITYLHNKMWYVLKSDELDKNIKINKEEYYLNQDDIIKLGRVKYAIQKIHIESKGNSDGEPPSAIKENKYDICKLNHNLGPVFEFIYEIKSQEPLQNETPNAIECILCKGQKIQMQINKETDDGEPNPLICVCKCKDNKYHYKCLKNYIKDNEIKIINQDDKVIDNVKILKSFECNECRQQFPLKFKYENSDKIYSLYDYEPPKNCDYMILESLDCKENEAYVKYIHIVKLIKEYITIGRDTDNDINNKNITISRKHALFRYDKENGRISLQNSSSKYGTLVLVRKPIKVLDEFIYLQNGRTFIGACLKNKEELKQNENMNKINE